MEEEVFHRLSQIARDRAGISLRAGKESLLEARIAKRMRVLGLNSALEYLHYLEHDQNGDEIIHFLDVISTNYTRFLREGDHFDLLRQEAARWAAEGQTNIRIWCAASSTGEEPYTLAIVLKDALLDTGVSVSILATDISTRALAAAREGIYDAPAVEPVPPHWLHRYFTVVGSRKSDVDRKYQVVPEIRQMVVFKRLNLAHPPFPMKGPLEAVFCRNVMIYFEMDVRARLILEAERLLRPGGLLFIGHSESIAGIQSSLLRSAASVYAKPTADMVP